MHTLQTSQRFIGVSAALFIGSAALTVAWCNSMPALRDMPMCSGRNATMHGAVGFLAMWQVMMLAMMLPSLIPMLLRYRQTVAATTPARLDALTVIVGLGYFFVWGVFGVFAFAGNAILHDVLTRSPIIAGASLLTVGALQFSRWKAHHLACCRVSRACCDTPASDASSAWRHGLCLGIHCVHCCAGLTVVLLVVGMMDLRAMALVTAAISAERLAPRGLHVTRFIGGILVVAGAFVIAHETI